MQFLAGRKLRASELNYDTETGVDCHYQAITASQSLPSGALTPIAYPTAVRTTPLAVQSTHLTVGHKFTVSRAGLWTITATVRFTVGGAVGSRFLGITDATSGTVLLDNGITVSNTGPVTLVTTGTIFLPVNAGVYAAAYVDGGAQSTAVTGNWVSWRMAWMHD